MADTLAVAKFLNDLNVQTYGENMNQMKMHKLMYFSQRESLMKSNNPLFDELFEAWEYGPVLVSVKNEYLTKHMFSENYTPLIDTEKELVNSVFKRYDSYNLWSLSTLCYAEYSWQKAREGLKYNEFGNKHMDLSAMKIDGSRELLRRKGVILLSMPVIYNEEDKYTEMEKDL